MPKPHKPKVDARNLVARLSKEAAALREREIVAPLLPGGKIRTRLSGMIHEFKPTQPFVGWGLFRPINEREAEPLGEALPWQRAGYLELLPALRVILLSPVRASQQPNNRQSSIVNRQSSVWWAVAYNESDAQQRFGLNGGELLPVFLCDPLNGAQAFERVIARVDGKTLWFEGSDPLADPTHAEWLRDATTQPELPDKMLPGLASSERLALLFWQIQQMETSEQLASLQAQGLSGRRLEERLQQRRSSNRIESRLRYALAKADATLHSYSELTNPDGTPGALVVEWSMSGQTYRYRSTIDPSLTVVSSGICLSGRDNDFDLTSLINVVAEAD